MSSSNTLRRIKKINFSLFSPEEIRKGSVCHILYPEVLEHGVPKESGLLDLRMGTIDKGLLCRSCNLNMFECVGHFGHIELCRPMFHIGFLSYTKKVLESVCYYCSKLKTNIRASSLDEAWNQLKTKSVCNYINEEGDRIGCGNKQPNIRKEGLSLCAVFKNREDGEGKDKITAKQVLSIFSKIRDEDLAILGFDINKTRPENMLVSVVLASPPCMRPSVITNGLRAEDDLTYKYADIIKANSLLKKYESEGAPRHIVNDYEQLLQYHIYTLMNNDVSFLPTATHKSGRPLKSIGDRIKGKEGRIRGSLMGKRVDFSARTVITPSSSIELDEVGVPVKIAMVHTFPEKVTSFNLEKLQAMVVEGPHSHPGANYVVRNDGQKIDLSYNRHELQLEPGFIVERHLVDGDMVIFNRQPSLHKFSMMGHRVKVCHKGKTFRLNLSATSPYNADFDGDEMNIHSPQNYMSKSELKNLTSVSKLILSPQSNKPVMGLVQDSLLSVRLITLKDTFLDRREASLLFSYIESSKPFTIPPAICYPKKLWTGKQFISYILPSFSYHRKCVEQQTNDRKELFQDDNVVRIIKGRLLTGILDKISFGATQGGLIHIIFNDFGYKAAQEAINKVQMLGHCFMLHIRSFSVGIGDATVDRQALIDCKENIANSLKEVNNLITEAKEGRLNNLPGLSLYHTFESKVTVTLNKARDFKGKVLPKNNLNAMILAGSKGSAINTCQITACVGQQNVEGHRISFGFKNRTLPHFTRFDYSSISRGFVLNSYLTGLFPHEFYFHAMGGREGIIDTAIKTSEIGYIQRKLVKSLEDAVINHNYSVVNSTGDIYQFKYGDDTFDGKRLETVYFNYSNFKERFFIDMFIDSHYEVKNVSSDVYNLMKSDFELQKLLDDEYEYLYDNRYLIDSYVSPCNVQRILENYTTSAVSDVNPYDVLAFHKQVASTDNIYLNYYLRYSLSVKTILNKLNSKQFNLCIKEIKNKLKRSMIAPHEMVGVLASQSIGQPATQMTLNTFHLAGVASTITSGVPRLTEIINIAQKLKTPASYIKLIKNSLVEAKLTKNAIEHLTIKDLCVGGEIVNDPDVTTTQISDDFDFVTEYFEMPDESVDYKMLGPLVIRLLISTKILLSHGIDVEHLIEKISLFFESNEITSHIIQSDVMEDSYYVFRIRIIENDKPWTFYQDLMGHLMTYHISGIRDIKKVYLVEEKKNINAKEGNSKIENDEVNWYLQTDGINFQETLSMDNVDGVNTIVNDSLSVYKTLGIEAARQSILQELINVIEGSGSYVNYRHLCLLSDIMTSRGYLTGITRHGVNKNLSSSVLKRASFEQPLEIFFHACVGESTGSFKGVSENIMAGQVPPCGTGAVDVVLDMQKLNFLKPKTEESIFSAANQSSPFSSELSISSEFSSVSSENYIVAEDYSVFGSESIDSVISGSKNFSPAYASVGDNFQNKMSSFSLNNFVVQPDANPYQNYTAASGSYEIRDGSFSKYGVGKASPSIHPSEGQQFSMTATSNFLHQGDGVNSNISYDNNNSLQAESSPGVKKVDFFNQHGSNSGGRYDPNKNNSQPSPSSMAQDYLGRKSFSYTRASSDASPFSSYGKDGDDVEDGFQNKSTNESYDDYSR